VSLDPIFLPVEDVIFLHDEELARFGGAPGPHDPGLLASAVGAPQASFGGKFLHPDLFSMAAAYAFHIAQNQPIVDANKRAGQAMIDIAERTMDKSGLADLLRESAQPL